MALRSGKGGAAGAIGAVALLAILGARSAALAAGDADNLPVPRFVSLHADRVNLRTGPGDRYPIEWVLTRKDMPVEIIGEFEHWRRVRDWEGTEGWVHQRMLAGKREVIVRGGMAALHSRADPGSGIIARAERGVVAKLVECQTGWCRIDAGEAAGWVRRTDLWGVYPDEPVP